MTRKYVVKILHYLFGLPPVRAGGLIRYALDLADGERKLGHQVSLLVPSQFTLTQNDKTRIIKGNWNTFECYKILNPLPVSYGKAIDNVSILYEKSNTNNFIDFLKKSEPEIIHIHSFMGLHIEFLAAAKQLNIPIIYTTHDYYGICPKAILMNGDKKCDLSDGTECAYCMQGNVSAKKIRFEQSEIYRILKSNKIINWLEYSQKLVPIKIYIRSQLKRNNQAIVNINQNVEADKITQYQELRQYYKNMFGYVDKFHFNSTQTKEIYEKHLGKLNGKVILISNKNIEDKRKRHSYDKKLKIGFIGQGQNKGYDILEKALKRLYKNDMTDFECHIYFNPKEKLPNYMVSHAPYTTDETTKVYDNMDILVLSSIWKETFGLVVLEALSHGVPVIVSKNVGAKEILEKHKGLGYIIEADEDSIYKALAEVYNDRNILKKMNEAICGADIDMDFEKHVNGMVGLYKKKNDSINN